MAERPPTSFRLSEECRALLRSIAQRMGIKDAAVVELAVRRLAKEEMGWEPGPAPNSPRAASGGGARRPRGRPRKAD
jgi:hypothetical protein